MKTFPNVDDNGMLCLLRMDPKRLPSCLALTIPEVSRRLELCSEAQSNVNSMEPRRLGDEALLPTGRRWPTLVLL